MNIASNTYSAHQRALLRFCEMILGLLALGRGSDERPKRIACAARLLTALRAGVRRLLVIVAAGLPPAPYRPRRTCLSGGLSLGAYGGSGSGDGPLDALGRWLPLADARPPDTGPRKAKPQAEETGPSGAPDVPAGMLAMLGELQATARLGKLQNSVRMLAAIVRDPAPYAAQLKAHARVRAHGLAALIAARIPGRSAPGLPDNIAYALDHADLGAHIVLAAGAARQRAAAARHWRPPAALSLPRPDT